MAKCKRGPTRRRTRHLEQNVQAGIWECEEQKV